jgi:hypothetical protein
MGAGGRAWRANHAGMHALMSDEEEEEGPWAFGSWGMLGSCARVLGVEGRLSSV